MGYNAISVQLKIQLPTGTELGKNKRKTRWGSLKSIIKIISDMMKIVLKIKMTKKLNDNVISRRPASMSDVQDY